MSFDAPENVNYAATIVKLPEPQAVPGLDKLVGIPMFGYQALTQKDSAKAGDLRVLFVAETQLDHEYASANNLYREATLNADSTQTGYLEQNARVKAIRLRKNQSDCLLMPLESLAYTGYDVSTLKVGDTFDKLNGHVVCRKYVPAGQRTAGSVAGAPKIRQRVDQKLFPMHLDTEHLFRNLQWFRKPRHVVITQKLHGTSWRGGNVPVRRDKGRLERLVNRLGIKTPDTEYEHVFGSRRVVKGRSDNNHYYESDLWTDYGQKLLGLIPKNFMVYGELIGWVDDQSPIQKGYTYNLLPGTAELYVYRVATVNEDGVIADLSWEGVKDFCRSLGLKWTPELWAGIECVPQSVDDESFVSGYQLDYLDVRFTESPGAEHFNEAPVPLSNTKTVDEGICVRIEGQIPRVFKAKSPKFLEHETKALDNNEVDLEAAA
ncbi:RNA ligase [Mycobacterium phage Whirlwind]|uniref:RNA ligase n=1 Tax=Mycobacterium phage Whirlwind TaxID=1340826 RepID=S5YML7_9CAUD|nr:RNA ligase [Mycobacterium phage Whirlwind]AGT12693.1 RNA ligase [Mycobacterium phage Whirlwind]